MAPEIIPEHTGIRQVFGRNLFSRQVQHQRRNHRHGFHHDAVGHHRRQRGNAVVVGEARATPIAKISGMLAKTEPPASAITWETTAGSQLKLAEPTPSRIPAIGNTDTGSMSDLPTFAGLQMRS